MPTLFEVPLSHPQGILDALLKVRSDRWVSQEVKRPATHRGKVFRPVSRLGNDDHRCFCFGTEYQFHDVLIFAIVQAVIANHDRNFIPG